LVRARGRCMAEVPGPAGVMASIASNAEDVEALLKEDQAVDSTVIACLNSHAQTVVAGEVDSVTRVVGRAKGRGWSARTLSAAHAFHSPLMFPAAEPFRQALQEVNLNPLQHRVVSTVTGAVLPQSANLATLLVEQLTKPVRFREALSEAAKDTDLLIEVGAGSVLTLLAGDLFQTPAVSLDVAGSSLVGVLHAAAAAYVLGTQLRVDSLFHGRLTRPFDLSHRPRFFANPCESA